MAKKLLLADDSVTIQKVVGISFASEDVTLITVDNGDDAISKARESRPDAILADVVMPGKSGYEVCEAIKADPALQHIPVLLLTGTFESFDEERAQRCGAAGHVAKPFEAQALVERVRQLFTQPVAPPPAPAAEPIAAPPAAEPIAAATPEPIVAATPEPIAAPPAAEPIAAAAPAPTPEQAPASGSSESFDFFDDDLGDLAPAVPAEAAREEADPTASDGAFAFGADEFDAPRADPLVSVEPEPASNTPLDRTVAILPDEVEAQLDIPATAPTELDASLEPAGPGTTDEDLLPAELAGPAEPVAPPADDFFDFDIGGSSAEAGGDAAPPVRSEDLAEATVLDPKGASGYDVSSSDLGDPVSAELFGEALASEDSLAMPIFGEPLDTGSQTPIPDAEPSAPETPVEPEPEMPYEPVSAPEPFATPEPAPAPEPAWPAEPADELEPVATLEPAPAPEPFATPEPAAAPEPAWPAEPADELEPVATLEPAPAPEPFATPEPTAAPEPFAAPDPGDTLEPIATPEPAWPPEPATPAFEVAADETPVEPETPALQLDESALEDLMPPARAEEPPPAASAADGDAQAAAVLEQITPRLREQLHDTLEKIAWESFGDVTEQIVRTALERVEQIAWEVIPQMAETMIREEIRRMKGESEG